MAAKSSDPPTGRRAGGPRAPRRIDRYRIIRSLGTGGMGTVYLAEDTKLERTIALKVLVKSDSTPPNLIHRFHSEARTAAKLRHPHIVTVYDSGESHGFLFLALEYVEGPDIERVIRKKGPLDLQKSLEIIRQITDALDHAHSAGVVHRDIKPSNILVRADGSATLTDMGLARAMGESAASNITRAGYTVGTVDYMAPEQARSSRAADGRSDLYSLGCTWFHMLTGRVPFPEGDLTNKIRAHAAGPPPDPRDIVPGVPAGIVAVIQRLMAQNPDHRYATPRELLADLDQPGLARRTVSSDDLRQLADEYERPAPPGAVDLHEHSGEANIPAGSTMIESADRTLRAGKQASRKPARRRPPRNQPGPVRLAPREKGADENAETGRSRRGDQIRAIILLALLLLLLAVLTWVFANLDAWIGGGPMPNPGRQPPQSAVTMPK